MGLSAEELNAETLFPGDTIEYYSMMFVAGDDRGYRVAKVLKVLKDESEYPLRLDSQELLPLTLMIRRKLDRHDDEVDHAIAKWRKIRTFKLVTGEVQGQTRADRLNAGLKQSIASAVSATLGERATGKSTHSRRRGDSDGGDAQQKPRTKPKPPKQRHASDRFQQQQLSFVQRTAPAPPHAATTAPRTPDASDKLKLKRSSLDSMSRALVSSSSPLKRQPTLHQASQTQKTPSSSGSSKYFGAQRPKARKQTALLSFVAQLEEKKSARSTTLDEYLALDQKQKDAVERRAQPSDATTDRESAAGREPRRVSTAAPASKWEQAKARFRAKQAPPSSSARSKTDARGLDTWLAQPTARDEASTPPRLKLKHKASPRTRKLDFLLPELERTSASSPAAAAAARAKDATPNSQRKRKRSSASSRTQRGPTTPKRHGAA